jgi:hypothetical protein
LLAELEVLPVLEGGLYWSYWEEEFPDSEGGLLYCDDEL